MPIQASPFSMGPERNKPPLDGLQPILVSDSSWYCIASQEIIGEILSNARLMIDFNDNC